jgi:hypothetical protein
MKSIHDCALMQRWFATQGELLPHLSSQCGGLTGKLEQLIRVLEWTRIEEFVSRTWCGIGRPPHDRAALANAFVAKAVLNLPTTAALVERLTIDRALRRICGLPVSRQSVPSAASFSRAFAEFAHAKLAERAHEALIQTCLGDQLIGHISRDATAIEARERPAVKEAVDVEVVAPPKKRGRPAKGEPPRTAPIGKVEAQLGLSIAQILHSLPSACDRGSKCNAQGYKNSWNGYKLHLDTADCGMPISALVTSASMHDSLASIPLARMSGARVSYCYELMDAAYCCEAIRRESKANDHVALIDHNPRQGEKIHFAPHEAERYKGRSQAERSNARLKDEFGANNLRVRGIVKVTSHLMLGVLVLAADQWMRLLL